MSGRKREQLPEKDPKTIGETVYTRSAACGSIQNLMKASKLSKNELEVFLAGTDSHTKYRTPRKKISSIESPSLPDKRNLLDWCCLHGQNCGIQ